MTREQAEEIVDFLIGAAFELDEVRAATEILEDRDEDAASLKELIIKLNSELLEAIFERFLDVLPFEEFPIISSSLRWNQVQLPPSASETEIDEIIFSFIVPRWRKMALIVWEVIERSKELGLDVSAEIFAARIQALVEAGRIEGQGDLRMWRHSEVRAKGEAGLEPTDLVPTE